MSDILELRDIGQLFLKHYPIGTVIPADQILKWVEEYGGNSCLKSDLLIGRPFMQLTAIRRHLNCVGASRDITEANRFYLGFTGRSRMGFIVQSLRLPTPIDETLTALEKPDKPTKHRRGRPKGSKNKPKIVATESAPQRRDRQRQAQPNLLDYRPQAGPSPSDQDLTRYLEPKADTAGDSRKEEIAKAVVFLRAAGYRVIKPRASKIHKPKDRVGPTFAAEFSDGVRVRMSTFTSLKKLDWGRGERLAQAAWQSRWRTARTQYNEQNGKRYGKRCLIDVIAPVPPAIVSAHFEQDGKVLAQRGQAPQSKPAPVLDDQPQSAPALINQSHTDAAPALMTFQLSYTNGDKYGGYVVVDVYANEIGQAGALFAAIRKANELKLSPGPDFSVNGCKLEPGMFPEHLKHRLLNHVQVDMPSREPAP